MAERGGSGDGVALSRIMGMARLHQMQPLVRLLGQSVLPAPKVADALYLSPEWRALVAEIKRDRGGCCEDCGSTHRVAGDHLVEVKDGGAPFDPLNVRLRCQACHNVKTAKVRADRARGR